MPNTFTASFASAAAGATSDNNGRRDGGGNDWTRSRVNGTQTFRRPSTQSRDNLQAATSSSTAPYIPPHLNTQAGSFRNGVATDSRYSRDDLVSIYKTAFSAGLLDSEVNRYFVGPWDHQVDSSDRVDAKDAGVEVCWNPRPVTVPLCLQPMDEAEERLFSTSVNSPLKMNNPKEGQSTGPGRKTSLSMVNTSGAPRPGARRRETSDSFTNNGPLSPSVEKTLRGESSANTPPAALLRRRTDYQDDFQERDDPRPAENNSPFGSLRRSGTGGPPSAGFNPPSASPWSNGPQSGFGAMGAMGAFSGLSNEQHSNFDAPPQRPALGSTRSQSRFAHTFKTSEDMSPAIKEKPSFNGLEKLPEEEDAAQSRLREQIKNRPNRSETNPYSDAVPDRSGSAALSAHDEPGVMEQMGFNPMQSAQTPHHRSNHDPSSPTNTNPWQSPQGGRVPEDEMHDGPAGAQNLGRRDVFSTDHRVQNSFGSLRGSAGAGLGGLGGWQNPGFGTGTPGRERPAVSAAFGDPVFSPIGGLQSPGGFGGGSFFGAPYNNRQPSMTLGLPFPSAMQDQMRSDSRNENFASRHDPFDMPRQEPFRTPFDEMKRPLEDAYGGPSNRSPIGAPQRAGSGGPHDGSGSSSPSQIPTAQQRQMVMPDRMRWVYRDPHGNVQGPWSGLEMHDWFKAGFFTAELQVKKQEDTEYEPLAQLVRRIGNSREPFLVPQIGVPHGPEPAIAPGPTWPGASGAAQPPFASAFPSFGTTLTAAQQNALERRKQEEQFLMARQKEFLNQRQLGMHTAHGQHSAHMHSLQHHSSAHSLHSQPSFGSMTSPSAYQQSPIPPVGQQNYNPGMPNMTPTSAQPPGSRDEEIQAQFNRLSMENRGPYSNNSLNQQSFANHERNRLSLEQQQAQQFAHENTFLGHQGRNDRLEEFNELRQDMDEAELDDDEDDEIMPAPIGSQRPSDELAALKQLPTPIGAPVKKQAEDSEPLSLTQQVQRTAAANKQAADEKHNIEPPPVSASPLPAPAAQRSRPTTVAEQLAAGSRSAAQTPVETPSASLAPWADKTSEIQKGPSLKEIQEAEAKRAAEQEAVLMEARRLQMEQERLAAAQVVPPAPGLPVSSTWASSGSPSTPTTPGGSVWAKSTQIKVAPSVPAKKTLAQIQKEEEARKQQAAAQAAANNPSVAYTTTSVSAGSRYAQMASKPGAAQIPSAATIQASGQPVSGGAWTTVGASGKPKTPATVVASPTLQRAVSTNSTAVTTRPPLNNIRSTSIAGASKNHARDELIKWTKSSMGKGLNSGTNVDNFVSTLLELPQELEIVADAIYAMSDTLDGRRFAEEFLRRRKLADKGVVEAESKIVTPADDKTNNGGWSEVAKKGPVTAQQSKEEGASATGFKVVSKKKGRR